MPRIKYRDDMTPAEREQFAAELEAIDAGYARASQDERKTRMIFNLVQCLADAMETAEAEGQTAAHWYANGREALAEADAMGYPALSIEDVIDADDEIRKAALSRGQP